MVITGIAFVTVTAIVKHIGGELPSAEAAFLRYVLGLFFLIPMLRPLLKSNIQKRHLTLFGWRGLVHSLGVILWFYAMARIPIADVTAMNYLSPIYVTIGAALFFGEKLAFRRILAVCAAIIGAMIILRPGIREISSGHIAMLFTAVLFAASYLLAKRMTDDFNPIVVVAMLSIMVPIGLAPFAFSQWVTPTVEQLGWLFLVSAFATTGHLTMMLAFKTAPMTVTQPVTFLQLVWATMLGALVFNEPIDGWVVIGGLIILLSVSLITWREAILKQRERTPPVI